MAGVKVTPVDTPASVKPRDRLQPPRGRSRAGPHNPPQHVAVQPGDRLVEENVRLPVAGNDGEGGIVYYVCPQGRWGVVVGASPVIYQDACLFLKRPDALGRAPRTCSRPARMVSSKTIVMGEYNMF